MGKRGSEQELSDLFRGGGEGVGSRNRNRSGLPRQPGDLPLRVPPGIPLHPADRPFDGDPVPEVRHDVPVPERLHASKFRPVPLREKAFHFFDEPRPEHRVHPQVDAPVELRPVHREDQEKDPEPSSAPPRRGRSVRAPREGPPPPPPPTGGKDGPERRDRTGAGRDPAGAPGCTSRFRPTRAETGPSPGCRGSPRLPRPRNGPRCTPRPGPRRRSGDGGLPPAPRALASPSRRPSPGRPASNRR